MRVGHRVLSELNPAIACRCSAQSAELSRPARRQPCSNHATAARGAAVRAPESSLESASDAGRSAARLYANAEQCPGASEYGFAVTDNAATHTGAGESV